MTTSELLKQYRLHANKTQKEWAGTAIGLSYYLQGGKRPQPNHCRYLIKLLDYSGKPH